jgi:predicted metal-dependent peptidase
MIDKYFILEKISKYPLFFQTFLDYAAIEESDELPTAGVYFDKYSYEPIVIKVNPKFWDTLNDQSKIFVICHELLHILFKHGIQIGNKDIKPQIFNKAADIVINHSLIDFYEFDFPTLSEFLRVEGCWIPTCFPTRNDILYNQNSTYYYEKLLENNDGANGFDEHFFLDAEDIKDFLESTGILEDFVKSGHAQEVYEQITGQSPTGDGSFHNLVKKRIPIKKKWETIIKKWESRVLKEEYTSIECWDRTNRRFASILNNDRVKLPTMVNRMARVQAQDMIDVFFFLDVSGSCFSYKDRFYAAAKSLNPKRFNLRLYSFDTSVTLLDINKWSIRGGGGTAFDIIEREIQRVIKAENLKKYPTIFVISDGDGNQVSPQVPERWHWFLTSPSDSRRYIHPKSKVYNLSDFE